MKSDRHVFLFYNAKNFETDLLPDLLASELEAHKGDMKKTKLTICEESYYNACAAGTVLVFPQMVKYRGLNESNVESFVQDVLINEESWESGATEALSGPLIFVCSHPGDKRCSTCGPILIHSLIEQIESRNLRENISVFACSLVGGHEYAGHVIIYYARTDGPVTGDWFGYITPDEVPLLIDQCSNTGKLGDPLKKHWRGRMGLHKRKTESRALSSRCADFCDFKTLGRGGFGSVVRCRNRVDDRTYAIKEIKIRNSRALREVKTLSTLHHPYVVRYHHAWLENSSWFDELSLKWDGSDDSNSQSSETSYDSFPFLYIQMEFCMDTLENFINKSKIENKWGVFTQVVEGLVYIHEMGVVHRDLHPKNIFLDSQSNVKIGDFGIAKFAMGLDEDELSKQSSTKGAPFYKPPDFKVVGPTYDLFSLGVLLFELWHPLLDTRTERSTVLTGLQKSEVPSLWADKFPVQASLVQQLTAEASLRPSATEVLKILKKEGLISEDEAVSVSVDEKLHAALMELADYQRRCKELEDKLSVVEQEKARRSSVLAGQVEE